MKKTLTILLIGVATIVFSQSKQDTTWRIKINKLEHQVNEIEKKNIEGEIKILNEKLDFQQKMSEQAVGNISNQLDAASYSLTLFGILFAIAAIGLGFYVTYIERKIVKIGEANQALLVKNQKIKDDVEAVNKLIQNDIYNLFLKIKREESVHILDRLVKVPKDISNVCDTLCSRELEHQDFSKLKQAYLNLPDKKDGNYGYYYLIVFFQHFLAQALRDETLREDISDFIPSGINAAFENDIAKSTFDFTALIIDKGIQEFKIEINQFFKGLTGSQFKNYESVYQLLFDNLKSRKNRFDLFGIIDSEPEKRLAKIQYGNLLYLQYSTDNPSESEVLAFTELTDLIAADKLAEVEMKQKEEEQKRKKEEREMKTEQRKTEQKERQRKLDEPKGKTDN